jgi:hypothetical protein
VAGLSRRHCAASGPTAPPRSLIQNASDAPGTAELSSFSCSIFPPRGEAIAPMPVTEPKERLRRLLTGAGSPLRFSDHQIWCGLARGRENGEMPSKNEEMPSKPLASRIFPDRQHGHRGFASAIYCGSACHVCARISGRPRNRRRITIEFNRLHNFVDRFYPFSAEI